MDFHEEDLNAKLVELIEMLITLVVEIIFLNSIKVHLNVTKV